MEKKMKKGTVLNSDISSVISRLGHTDTLVVCDAGLPIPRSTARIDMALTQGVPTFMQVLGVVTQEMQVEAAILAAEIHDRKDRVSSGERTDERDEIGSCHQPESLLSSGSKSKFDKLRQSIHRPIQPQRKSRGMKI
jgi:D-ribose pyranose/furanose isomerase RbsD